ncbi:hypothetical protein Mapa_008194 [Marchantia paleacea]|nr:hypothetical protein Mapa_008194 [Marchantia paleacea]
MWFWDIFGDNLKNETHSPKPRKSCGMLRADVSSFRKRMSLSRFNKGVGGLLLTLGECTGVVRVFFDDCFAWGVSSEIEVISLLMG